MFVCVCVYCRRLHSPEEWVYLRMCVCVCQLHTRERENRLMSSDQWPCLWKCVFVFPACASVCTHTSVHTRLLGVPLCMCAFLHLFVHSQRKTQRQMGNMERMEGACRRGVGGFGGWQLSNICRSTPTFRGFHEKCTLFVWANWSGGGSWDVQAFLTFTSILCVFFPTDTLCRGNEFRLQGDKSVREGEVGLGWFSFSSLYESGQS